MAFGIYIHIPYCLQICPYCDFSKYEWGKIMPPEQYVQLLEREIESRSPAVGPREVDTIYFGGGTPSLFKPPLILAILTALAKNGFKKTRDCEVTLEINPATVSGLELGSYLDAGVNRFSVGAQTFNDRLLKLAGRKHNAADTIQTLTLLKKEKVNYSFDILFALPTQRLTDLVDDLKRALDFEPHHVSPYCLTVPEGHPMSKARAPENEQIEMFHLLEEGLEQAGIMRYEISNFAKPGMESKHNLIYWTDQEYWGLGLSAHSYLHQGSWGTRFWNPPRMPEYEKQIFQQHPNNEIKSFLTDDQFEQLERHQAMTDFCHTALRIETGLSLAALRLKFGDSHAAAVEARLELLAQKQLVFKNGERAVLTQNGRMLSNQVFAELTFLRDELPMIDNL